MHLVVVCMWCSARARRWGLWCFLFSHIWNLEVYKTTDHHNVHVVFDEKEFDTLGLDYLGKYSNSVLFFLILIYFSLLIFNEEINTFPITRGADSCHQGTGGSWRPNEGGARCGCFTFPTQFGPEDSNVWSPDHRFVLSTR